MKKSYYGSKGKKRYTKKPKEKPLPGLAVRVYNNNIELALKKFKKKVKNSGLMNDLREKQYYTKPSDARRSRKKLAMAREKYKNTKEKKSF